MRSWISQRKAVVISGVITIALAGVTIVALITLLDIDTKIEHSHEIDDKTQVLFQHLEDAETGQRGYLLTHKKQYLIPYNQAIDRINGELLELTNITKNSKFENQISKATALIKDKLAELAETIEVHDTQGYDAAIAIVLNERGRRDMDELRQIFLDIKNSNKNLLHLQIQKEKSIVEKVIAIIVLKNLLTVVVIFVLNNAIDKYLLLNHNLDKQVRDRTRDLKQSNTKLIAADKSKDEFLAVLSHELRHPLTSIKGWVQLLLSGNLDNEKTIDALKTIERNADMQERLIKDILEISKIVQGKLRLSFQPIDLIELLESVIESIKPSAEIKGIAVNFISNTVACCVMGDYDKLIEVFWNILSNAVKFTEKGKIETKVEERDSNVKIIITDTGIGIPLDFLPYVFDRFKQGAERSSSGLGVGLAIAKEIVEMHGGKIKANSAGVDKGASFTVTLRVSNSSCDFKIKKFQTTPLFTSTVTSKSVKLLQGLSILVVDDDHDARELLSTILEQYGANAIAASSAQEAIVCVNQNCPNLIISDIGMPYKDGYSFIKEIREMAGDKGRVPAIALTAFVGEGDKAKALLSGYQRHISKPMIDPMHLVVAILNLVQN